MTKRMPHQQFHRSAEWIENGRKMRLVATVRHDDRCHNGYNTFSITGALYEDGRNIAGGCLHQLIADAIPELAPYVQWHLCSTDGPLHYVANTTYWAREGNIGHARSSAIWPDASLAELADEAALLARLPTLMADFRETVESLGLTY